MRIRASARCRTVAVERPAAVSQKKVEESDASGVHGAWAHQSIPCGAQVRGGSPQRAPGGGHGTAAWTVIVVQQRVDRAHDAPPCAGRCELARPDGQRGPVRDVVTFGEASVDTPPAHHGRDRSQQRRSRKGATFVEARRAAHAL